MSPPAELPPLPEPATTADERSTLVQFLDYFRAVLERKVHGLDETQVRMRVGASTMDLLGMMRHMADVERWWFRCVLLDEVDGGLYDDPDDRDADWHHRPGDTLADALSHWHAEVARAREIVAATADLETLTRRVEPERGLFTLRWILVHMIEEYARHVGHADLIREAIDGSVGD